ncbi:MAG: hypothetical protein IKU29_07090 [Parabacteroides sp.]|nr:hypothetical protein [Parabacteroides sp.]
MSRIGEAYQLLLSITPEDLRNCWFRNSFISVAMITNKENRLLSDINFHKDTAENWAYAYNILLNNRKSVV